VQFEHWAPEQASAINLTDLEPVVVGGGLGTRLGDVANRLIPRAMEAHLFISDQPPDVRLSELGDVGGAIASARLVPIGRASPTAQ
jgi:hypothetical protein